MLPGLHKTLGFSHTPHKRGYGRVLGIHGPSAAVQQRRSQRELRIPPSLLLAYQEYMPCQATREPQFASQGSLFGRQLANTRQRPKAFAPHKMGEAIFLPLLCLLLL